MRPRNYAIVLIAIMTGLFLAVVGTNLIIDPEGVLGTGLFGGPHNGNDRYLKMRAYLTAPDRYDGLRFGSSRANDIPLDELSRRMDGAIFADFAVPIGQIEDHLAVLEYIVHAKAAHGRPIRAVFLLLDVDIFGQRPYANHAIESLWPPALTGESTGRFFWRYLTAIQFRAWRGQVHPGRPERRPATIGHAQSMQSERMALGGSIPRLRSVSATIASYAQPAIGRAPMSKEHELITTRANFEQELALLAKFVDLCSRQGIKLAVALSPLMRSNASQYDSSDIEKAVQRIGTIVPVWDFDSPQWLSDRADLWRDISHFSPEVGTMMLDRMFGTNAANVPKDFGVLRR